MSVKQKNETPLSIIKVILVTLVNQNSFYNLIFF